jgi:hypothetical protein
MTMVYLDIALTDRQREFERACAQPRHLVPQPKIQAIPARPGLEGVLNALLVAQHIIEMYRRALPDGPPRRCLNRLLNRLTKIASEARKLQ